MLIACCERLTIVHFPEERDGICKRQALCFTARRLGFEPDEAAVDLRILLGVESASINFTKWSASAKCPS